MTFKYFTRQEFDCQETGENEMEDEFIHALDALRHQCRIPFRITSGFRAKSWELANPLIAASTYALVATPLSDVGVVTSTST